MRPLVISSSHLGPDGDDFVLATTPEDLDLIAYVIMCNDLKEYLAGPPEPPTPPEIFETLPDGRLKEQGRFDWRDYERKCEVHKKILSDNAAILQKIHSRDSSGCWELMPDWMVNEFAIRNPLNFLDDYDLKPNGAKYTHSEDV